MNKVKQVFTFGFGQQYEGGYVVIYASSKAKCREKMFKEYGAKWSMQYNDEEQAGVDEWKLKLIKVFGTQN